MKKTVGQSEKYKKIFWGVFSPLIAVLTVWAVLKQNESVSISEIIDTARRADPVFLMAAGICSFLYVWFEGVAVRSIVKSSGYRQSRRNGLIYAAADVYFSAITPSATGGQPASAYFMTLDGIPGGVTAAALVLNIMMYTVSVVVLGIIAFIVSPGAFFNFSASSRVFIAMGAVVLSMLSAFFLLLLVKGDKVFLVIHRIICFFGQKGIIKRTEKLLVKLEKAKKDYSRCAALFSKNHGLLVRAFLWNFLQRASQIVVPMILYLSFGGKSELACEMFSRQCLITIGYNFVPIPGAMGIADYLMIDGFSGIVGREGAVALEMLGRGLTFYICVTLSGIITLIGYILKKRIQNQNLKIKL